MASPKAPEAIEPVEEPRPGLPAMDSQDAGSMTKIIHNAKAATDKEQNMTLLQGLRLYPKAAAWSVLISTCIAMEGYDISLINNFYAFPQFRQKYGVQMSDGSYQVPAPVGCPLPR
jgi:SP family general alpha glucoside:H+ symporter-like MFS transporter